MELFCWTGRSVSARCDCNSAPERGTCEKLHNRITAAHVKPRQLAERFCHLECGRKRMNDKTQQFEAMPRMMPMLGSAALT
jgi:hypothetical protein